MSGCGKALRALIFRFTIFLAMLWLLFASTALAERPKTPESTGECSSFAEAKKRIGQKSCIRGQVLRVEHSPEGMSYLNFCEDSRVCPFSVVVFAEDLHHVGALETLVGRTIEIRGKVRDSPWAPSMPLRARNPVTRKPNYRRQSTLKMDSTSEDAMCNLVTL